LSKIGFKPSVPATSEDDFEVSTSYRLGGYRRFFGRLQVVRTTDGKLLYPFDGAQDIGPFITQIEALAAAQVLGERIVEGDLANPEL
jgi:hypothetical protein